MKPDGVIIETGPEHNHDSFMLEKKSQEDPKRGSAECLEDSGN